MSGGSEIKLSLTKDDIDSLRKSLFAAYTVNHLCEDKDGTRMIENLRAKIEHQIEFQEEEK